MAKAPDTNKDGTPRKQPGPKTPRKATIPREVIIIGRAQTPVDPLEVEKLAALGCTLRDIARFFGADEKLVKAHFGDIIDKAREGTKISLRRAMINNAIVNNNVVMQIFLSKNILGMSDNPTNTDDNDKILPWN